MPAARATKVRGTKRVTESPVDKGKKIKKAHPTPVNENVPVKKPLLEDITSGSDEEYSGKLLVSNLVSTPIRFPGSDSPSPKVEMTINADKLSFSLENVPIDSEAIEISMDELLRNCSPVKRSGSGSIRDGTIARPPTPMPGTPKLDPYADMPPLEPASPYLGIGLKTIAESPKAQAGDKRSYDGPNALDTRARAANVRTHYPRGDDSTFIPIRKNAIVNYVNAASGTVVAESAKHWSVDVDTSQTGKSGLETHKPELNIQDYIPSLEDFVNPGNVTAHAMRRIVSMAQRDNPIAKRFRISGLPLSAKWGTTTLDAEDYSRYMCLNNHPIRITIAGRVVSSFFYNTAGEPVSRVSIGVVPLRNADIVAYNALINDQSSPKLNDERDIVYAGRFQTERVRGQAASLCKEYRRVFDMTSGPKMKRDPRSAAMIANGDIVMLECNVCRFRPTNGSGSRRPARAWDHWTALLELQDILYIYQSPDDESTADAGNASIDGEEY